ncbi:MAG: outer membrane beta-barrel protein [Aliarcobacter sp.]|jgi:opacity protein-like surface antigen|nr:outer membrane beta-barrel protein [Aliarcobacter sp.]
MKKQFIIASLLAASTSMMAMDLQYFLGAAAERVDSNNKDTYSFSNGVNTINGSDSYDFKDTGLLLRAGIILDKTHRISLSHVKFSKDGVDATTITGNYDYLIPINEQVRLYAGLHAGNTKVEIDEDDFDMSGLAYGAQVGAIYDITKNVEFELGLAYTKYNVDESISGTLDEGSFSGKTELENSTSMFAGINYKF